MDYARILEANGLAYCGASPPTTQKKVLLRRIQDYPSDYRRDYQQDYPREADYHGRDYPRERDYQVDPPRDYPREKDLDYHRDQGPTI